MTSASGLKRFIACPASSVLPHVGSSSKAADDGTAIHLFLERALVLGKEEALEHVKPELYDRCKNIDVDSLKKDITDIQQEVAFALNPVKRTARIIGYSIGRNYPEVEDGEIVGTADIIARSKMWPKMRVVQDFKTGDYVEPAASNKQLGFFSACLYLMEGGNEFEQSIVYILENGDTEIDRAKWVAFDLEDYLDTLAGAYRKFEIEKNRYAETGSVNVVTGDHCRYCNSAHACPAQVSLVKKMIPELTEMADMMGALTPEQAGRAWELKKQIGSLYDKVDDGLKLYAKLHGIGLPNGKRVGMSSYTRKYLSEDKTMALLSELGASKDQIAGLYSSKTVETVRELGRKGDK